ncbi:glycosyltransferase family 2 protein [Candidatus Peregrinibacteria bacterium]|nr:glycosyltransferase family 2 protein [Candidatus Peregrinibacteria bacterium]
MELSIIIPTYNRADILRRCLEHLARQEGAPTFEVIVVGDGCTDNTKDIIQNSKLKIKNLKYIEQPPSQQGIARNRGAREAQGRIVCFIGDDIFVAPDFVKRHVEAHQKHPEEFAAVLGFTTWHPELPINAYMHFLERGWQFNYPMLTPGLITHPAPYKFFYTSNVSLKKSFFQKEPFDDGFQGYGWEDIELAYRLWNRHGMQIFYAPEAKAYHYHAFTEADLSAKMRQIGRAAKVFQEKHPELAVIPKGFGKWRRTVGVWPIFLPLFKRFWTFGYYYFLSWREFFKDFKNSEKAEVP